MPGRQSREAFLEERLAGVTAIGKALSSTLDLDALLPRLMDLVVKIMGCERSTLFLVDPDKGELWSKVFQGEDAVTVRLPVGRGIAGEVARTGESLNIEDAQGHPLFLPDIDRLTGYRTRTLLTTPLRDHGGRVTGVVQVLNRRDGRPFDEDDRTLLESLSSQLSLALQTAWLYTSAVRHNREIGVLARIDMERSRCRDPEEVLERVLASAIEALECEAGSILLVHEAKKGKLYFRKALGEKGEALDGYTIDLGQGIVGWTALHGRPARVNDAAADERYDPSLARMIDYPVRQALAVPLRSDGEVIGAVEVINRAAGAPFTEESERFLSLIASRIDTALREAREACAREREDRLATIGKMLSGVVHDLKNPLTVITSYAEFLKTEADGDRREMLAERILHQSRVLRKMTEDLLAFARGESRIFARKVYLHLYLGELAELVHAEAAGGRVKVKWHRDYEGAAWFDPDSLRRALLNLVRNAVEAMKDGGTLDISTTLEDGKLVFRVADNGPGIPPEIRERLFEPFVTKGKENGTGLGLAIVRQVALDHGGEVEVETAEGKGTTFTLSLPLEEPAQAERRSFAKGSAAPGTPRRRKTD